MKTALAACLTILLLAPSALAGWAEIGSEGSRTLFSEGRIRNSTDAEATWNVFDTRTGELTMVDDERRIYSRAQVEDYCQAIRAAADEALRQMSPEERGMMEQLMGALTGLGAGDEAPQVRVEGRGPGEEVAGYATERYRVLVNGRLYQELWIAPEAPVLEELDLEGLQKYQKEMAACLARATPLMTGPAPETSSEYEELMRRGWVMRSVHFDGNGEPLSESEVERLERREIAPAEFDAPEGYRRVPVGEFMEGGT